MINLKNILKNHPEAAGNYEQMKGLLLDHYPDYEKEYEKHILLSFIETGIVNELAERKDHPITLSDENKYINRLINQYGYQKELCESIFRLWVDALQLKFEDEVEIDLSNGSAPEKNLPASFRDSIYHDRSVTPPIQTTASRNEKTDDSETNLQNSKKPDLPMRSNESTIEEVADSKYSMRAEEFISDHSKDDFLRNQKKSPQTDAETPDPEKIYEQGMVYYDLYNFNAALPFIQIAAEQGCAKALFQMAIMYRKGQGVKQSDSEAVKYYQLAADQGNAQAQTILGYMYQHGKAVSRSDQEAMKYYRLAADQGHAEAQYRLGNMYERTRSDQEAVKYYRLAADQGYAPAQYRLGYMYQFGYEGVRSEQEAVKYYRLAADQGYAEAQYNLGLMYRNGQVVGKSDEMALKYYRLAADQGHAKAQYKLGYMYEYGFGLPEQSYYEARKYYQMAADQGDTDAIRKLIKG